MNNFKLFLCEMFWFRFVLVFKDEVLEKKIVGV